MADMGMTEAASGLAGHADAASLDEELRDGATLLRGIASVLTM